jgi:hypothetical protein
MQVLRLLRLSLPEEKQIMKIRRDVFGRFLSPTANSSRSVDPTEIIVT